MSLTINRIMCDDIVSGFPTLEYIVCSTGAYLRIPFSICEGYGLSRMIVRIFGHSFALPLPVIGVPNLRPGGLVLCG